MARTVRDANLETRTARLRLPIRTEPYWRGLEKGFALGYRRRAKGGTWLARRRQADGGYAEHRIGTTDDLQDADGVAVLDYGQAQKAAREWWRAEARREEGHDTRQGPFTVADAMADYLKAYERRGGKAVYETQRAAETHILPALGTTTGRQAHGSQDCRLAPRVAEKRARVRTKPGRRQNYRKADTGPDAIRKRRATANRILTVLKAALNHAWKAGHVASDDAWRRVKPFKAVETARVRYLSEAECVRLVNACEPAFRNLVRGALLTGCRYSELAGMRAADFNADAGVVTVRESKAGKPATSSSPKKGSGYSLSLTAGKLGRRSDFHPRRRWRVGKVASIATDAGSQPASEDQAGNLVPCAPPHPRLDTRHARRADGRHCRTAWARRHADDGKALCAPGPILRRRHDPCAFPGSWHRGR